MKKYASSFLLFCALTSASFGQLQTINTGTSPNDGTGDSIRAAFTKINANESYLYAAVGNLGNIFNVKASGAKGDGLTDDTIAIRVAIARATNSGGGVIYFPAGTYRVSSTIMLPLNGNMTAGGGSLPRYSMTLMGDGQGTSHIKMVGTGDLFNCTTTGADSHDIAMADHYSFVDLDLQGPGLTSLGAGMHFGLTDEGDGSPSFNEGIQWLKLQDCHISGFSSGLAVTNCVEMFINRCFFESNYSASISLKKVDSATINDCFIGFNWAYAQGAGFTAKPYEGVVILESLFTSINNGTFQSCRRPFRIHNSKVRIQGGNWEDCSYMTENILSTQSSVRVVSAKVGDAPTPPSTGFAFLRADAFAGGGGCSVDDTSWAGAGTKGNAIMFVKGNGGNPLYTLEPMRSQGKIGYSSVGGTTNEISATMATTLFIVPTDWDNYKNTNNFGKTIYIGPSEQNGNQTAQYFLIRSKNGSTNYFVEDLIPSNLLANNLVLPSTNAIVDGLQIKPFTPASSAAAGTNNTITFDSSYIYVYIGNAWRRAAISTW